MARSSSDGVEHRVRMPAHRAGKGKGASPENRLNCFVRIVAFIERVGNALGILAFTWATVVLLGGYPTVLLSQGFGDFWCATIIVFLEAARMFSRNNKLDYQMFFHTKGAFRRLGWNGLIVIVYLTNIGNYRIGLTGKRTLAFAIARAIVIVVVPLVLGMFQSLRALKLFSKRLRYAISIWSPLVAILLMVPSMTMFTTKNKTAKWTAFLVIFLPVLLLTISRLRFPTIIRLVDSTLGTKIIFWRRLILNLCMFAALVVLVFIHDDPLFRKALAIYEAYAFVVVSFGNLQFPAAVARVVLSLTRLVTHTPSVPK